jgi:hypothetical protein
MTQYLNKTGNRQQAFGKWSPTVDYPVDSLVIKDNRVYRASSDVPAGTPFALGTSGPTWQEAVAGSDATVGVPFPQLHEGCGGFGRITLVGNTFSRAGDGDENQARVYGFGQPNLNTQSSIGVPMNTTPPDSWAKFWDTGWNLFALTHDGVLYGFSSNGSGQLGDGTTNNRQYLSVLTGGGRWYGPGITVLNAWTYDSTDLASTDTGALFVHVDNNGTLQTWSCGNGNNGILGNGTVAGTSAVNSTPFLIPQLTGKSIINGFITRATAQFVTSTGEVWGAGYNFHGSLGIGTTLVDQLTFQQAKLNATTFVTNAVEVYNMWDTGAGLSSYILLSDKTVLSSGTGNGGRLGDGDTSNHGRAFFQPVLRATNTPLTNITKIEITAKGAAFLDTAGTVFWTGINFDNIWGNGEVRDQVNIGGWASPKQTDVLDFWGIPTPRNYLAVFYLKSDYTLWACGYNVDFQLGVVFTGEDFVSVIQRVALPRDEYPVKIKRAGDVSSVDGIAYVGTLFLTQKGNIYYTGRSVGVNPDSLNNAARFPRLIIDNLINEQTRTL